MRKSKPLLAVLIGASVYVGLGFIIPGEPEAAAYLPANRSDLVDHVATSAGLTRAEADRAVEAVFGVEGFIALVLRGDQRMQITGFGTFEAKHRKARMGRNPRTGNTIHIRPSKTPGFRAGQGLKDAIQ